MKQSSLRLLWLAAAIAVFGSLIHLAAIAGGPEWYLFFGAPPAIVASAREGTWLAPIATLVIALLMAGCAAYACSAIGVIARLPLLRPVLAAIGALCLVRALILIPVGVFYPQLLTTFEIVASAVWGIAGIGFSVGVVATRGAVHGRSRPGSA